MAASKSKTRMSTLLLANILIPISVLLFATGFFPYKPFLSGLATFEEVETEELGLGLLSKDARPTRVFDKVIFMVVDALRSDFVYGHGSGFVFTQSLIRTGAAVPLTAHAAPPTVTMPRVKGLTSGSVPSFLDLILNFAESDTSSSLATQDTWLAQIKAHLHPEDEEEGKLVFYGDDTWLKLFPDFFARADGTSSFFVSDFTEVDNNVTRHLPHELQQPDWNAMIMHYLGLDHIGHKSGPLSPNMLPKQQEMDGIVETIYQAMNTLPHLENTLLVLAGDHGMNSAGNHGGSAAGETSPALTFISPKLRQVTCDADLSKPADSQILPPTSALTFYAHEQKQKVAKINTGDVHGDLAEYMSRIWNDMRPGDKAVYERLASHDRVRYEEDREKAYCKSSIPYKAPAEPKNGSDFEYYRQVEQSDLVPTLAALLGVPVSINNLGLIVPEMLKFWQDENPRGKLRPDLELLYRNSLQILRILKVAYGDVAFESSLDKSKAIDLAVETEACKRLSEGVEELSCKWRLVKYTMFTDLPNGGILLDFLATAQDTLSATASSYNVRNLVAGTAVAILATILAVFSKKKLYQPTAAGVAFTVITALYGIMMFASSYVEEEQHFWYWTTSAWILCLYFTRFDSSSPNGKAAIATFLLLAAHRSITRWNQTGQKQAGAPDVAHHFFPAHHITLWILVLATYIHSAIRLGRRAFFNLTSHEISAMTALSLALPSLMFKLNFTQADSPELVQGLAEKLREYTAEWDLIMQARATFVGLGIAAVGLIILTAVRDRFPGDASRAKGVSLPQRLHDLLTLFLMTQTRVQNIPLFLLFEIQLQLLKYLLSPPAPPTISEPDTGTPAAPPQPTPPLLPATLTLLLLTHTSYFAFGGSNAISSIDLSNAYNGISDYNILAVGILLFCSNWAGPIWWSLAAVLMIQRLRDGPEEIIAEEWVKLKDIDNATTVAEAEKDKGNRAWVQQERALLAQSANSVTATETETETQNQETLTALPVGERSEGLWAEHISSLTIFVCAGLVAVMAACTVLRTHLFIWTVFSPKYLYAAAWGVGWHLGVNVGIGGLFYLLGRW